MSIVLVVYMCLWIALHTLRRVRRACAGPAPSVTPRTPYYAILCYAILLYVMLYHTILYYTIASYDILRI